VTRIAGQQIAPTICDLDANRTLAPRESTRRGLIERA